MKKMAVAMLVALPMVGWGADSGFLDDYSILDRRESDAVNRIYIAPGTLEVLSTYDAVMVDQPEVFMSPDSKYKGAKPDHIKTLADTARQALIERLEAGDYRIAEEENRPGLVSDSPSSYTLLPRRKLCAALSCDAPGWSEQARQGRPIGRIWP